MPTLVSDIGAGDDDGDDDGAQGRKGEANNDNVNDQNN